MPSTSLNQRHSLYALNYPDPFLDQASTKLPKSQKKLFEMLHIFSTTHPQIRPIVHKLAKYPITHLIINGDEASLEEKWRDIMEWDLNIYEVAESVGLDYMGYGNAFVTIHRPFVRTYKCKSCGVDNPSGDVDFYFRGKKVVGKCPSCKNSVTFEPHDQPLESTEKISIVTIPPKEMYIKVNRSTGEQQFFRDPPKELKKAIDRKPDRFIVNTTPWQYVKAALHNKKIKYGKNRILHLKEPTLSHHKSHWGQPIIMAALKDAYLNQVYKKADETNANERSVPARFIFPQMTSRDPMKTIGLKKWSAYMEMMIKRRRHDPNAVMPSPFPVGVAEVGGDVQRLTTASLRELVIREIIGSTGVPEGFLSDGMTYSGGTVQARMLENMIMSYLRAQDKLLKYVVREVVKIAKIPKVDIKWKPFRKADDVQMLQILLQLMQMKHVSGKEILDRMDLDWESEHERIMEETEKIQDVQVKESLTEVKSMLESVDYQVHTQGRQGSSQEMLAAVNQTAEETVAQLSGKPEEVGQEEAEQEEEQEQDPRARLMDAKADQREIENERRAEPIVERITQRIMSIGDPEAQEALLNRLKQSSPGIHEKVEMRLMEIQGSQRVKGDAKNPDEVANRILMMQPNQRAKAFKMLRDQDPRLAIIVMKKLQEAMRGSGSSAAARSSSSIGRTDESRQRPPTRSNQ